MFFYGFILVGIVMNLNVSVYVTKRCGTDDRYGSPIVSLVLGLS